MTAHQMLADIRQAQKSGDRISIVSLAENALQSNSDDLISLVNISITLRDCGYFQESKLICEKILGRDQYHPFALYELATVDAMQGQHVEALIWLERLLDLYPLDERALLFAARMSARIGAYAPARNYVSRLDEIDPKRTDLAWLRNLIDFMEAYPSGVADRMTQLYERDPGYVSAEIIASWIAVALEKKEAFSLIRLGDGEGAFCRISSEDEARYAYLYEYCRQDRSHVWFNGEIDIHSSGFAETAYSLREAVRNANVVGMPYRNWVSHEYKYCSPTGIVCLVNALRLGQLAAVKNSQSWTTQLVHVEFLHKGLLENIIRKHRRISLISCLSDAASALKSYFELDEVELYRIPGEKAHSVELGAEILIGKHYPDRFLELLRELDKPLHGQLFLVAGGILGKLYCNQIKKSGGVAIDIGSVVDTWMGKSTRPGTDPKYKISL